MHQIDRLYLSITNRCNLHCKHCFRSAGVELENELSVSEYRKILESASNVLRSRQISITGGEPFMRSDLFELMDLAADLEYLVDLSTNGLLLDEDILRRLTDYPNVFYMQISVDGLSKETYEYIRGQNTYECLLHNLELVHKSEFLNMIDLMMIFLVTPQNINEIELLPSFAKKYGFDKVAIGEILPFGNGQLNYPALDTCGYSEEIHTKIMNANKKSDIPLLDQFHFGFLYNGTEPTPCTARQGKVLAIEPNGEILICPYDTSLHMGNIREFDYNISAAYNEIYPKIDALLSPQKAASECPYYAKCNGGCPLLQKKFGTECDPRCKMINQ